ncbi:MarR family winged helix-turn-helix transcriptional regulator [Brucella pituitosa]|uniref:Winged helix-turn-helix transcriptional regulator n=1 Tax=Brucella pituitosa TaxID=571256 RepID=A0A643EV68_9HYPH|nr:MarR family winged helix-turn-helix transcriptional regulator [Brucella pituitosa]PQZ47545.1 MarR family transcriptional regulator [Ochrobactrum sp. MYb19]PRA63221.1 MarR family transcriptional regulator [Ochrobactrum sp. MYb18]PRA73425.1 MarR family transcriptional regulator [Brucella thiophenivorans]PRA88217.1 MarR family transcriptional regulator [Ochrobactrum sp. MYb14]PRA94948.1 MarR family transcriptional regulator [Ochrobactrum sp. MYb15]
MTSMINVHNTHNESQLIRELHESLIDIVTLMNRPQRDEQMVREAGIALDRALFPLLVGVERRGPIGIVELADGTGRDYSTVSRQVTKLESLDLVERRQSAADKRVNEVVVTSKGKAMTAKIDAAREKLARSVFKSWDKHDVNELVRLMRKFADAVKDEPTNR